ncbi:MAG: response regulator receiver protein [Vampirovibrio sp.]|nr:response regulator receiver protein [Vampirovibrio sp.]
MSSNLSLNKTINILIADDDPDDRLMAREALVQSHSPSHVNFVEDGEELLDYLYRRGKFQNVEGDLPDLILLDLNMPRKSGVEALQEIKSDNTLRHIPIVVLTTSKEEEDIYRTYDLGVNSFITKPITYESLVNTMRILGKYWFEVVQLPSERHAG